MKKTDRETVSRLEDLPNVGKAAAGDLRRIGIELPRVLIGRELFSMYEQLCAISGHRHDPCVIDVFMSAIHFMEGGEALPLWHFTASGKEKTTRATD